jgi:TldD protein
MEEDPRSISMEEKLALTRSYNLRPLQQEKIVTTQIQYLEVVREKFFINTEGTQIREDLVTTRLGGTITSQDGGLTQTVRVTHCKSVEKPEALFMKTVLARSLRLNR